ncbi:hypothetical protein DRQ32_05190 [bacterium]|nr:MAG: hypothetical protein DRQ32_05190 [bacterium]
MNNLSIKALGALCIVMRLLGPPDAIADAPPEILYMAVSDAVQLALEQGVEAGLVREEVTIAEAQVGVVRSLAIPRVSLEAGYRHNLMRPVIFFPDEDGNTQSIEIGRDSDFRAGLTLRQPVYAFGRLRNALRSANTGAEATRLAGDFAAAEIALAVKTAYYQALFAHEQARIAELSLEQLERSADQIGKLTNKGLRSEFEKLRSDVAVANRRPAVAASANERTIALENLKRLLGLPLDEVIVLTDSLMYSPLSISRESAVEQAIALRKDVASARTQVAASEEMLRAQAANDRPLLFLDGNYNWQGQTSTGITLGNDEIAQSAFIGLSLSWPVFDGLENRYRTQQARANWRKAEFRLRKLEDEARLELRSTWTRLESVIEELAGTEEAIALAERSYHLAQVRFEAGIATLLDVLDSELALTRARLVRLEELFRYSVLLAELETQTGLGPDLTPGRSGH